MEIRDRGTASSEESSLNPLGRKGYSEIKRKKRASSTKSKKKKRNPRLGGAKGSAPVEKSCKIKAHREKGN